MGMCATLVKALEGFSGRVTVIPDSVGTVEVRGATSARHDFEPGPLEGGGRRRVHTV